MTQQCDQNPVTLRIEQLPYLCAVTASKNSGKKQLTQVTLNTIFPDIEQQPWHIHHTRWGKPYIDADEISVSYSYCQDVLYAGVSHAPRLGIDAASADEFRGNYPFHRVFGPSELHCCKNIVFNQEEAAALLWACKEAIVKALGSGFRGIEPLDIHLLDLAPEGRNGYRATLEHGKTSTVHISRSLNHWLAVSQQK